MKRSIDLGYRGMFAYFVAAASYGALTNHGTSALFIMVEGTAGWVVVALMACMAATIFADVAFNNRLRNDIQRWPWIVDKRDIVYLVAVALVVTGPVSLSKASLMTDSAAVWYYGLAAWGLHLFWLDLRAKRIRSRRELRA